MAKYSVWTDYEEQWEMDDLPPPEDTVTAFSAESAAEKFANRHGFGETDMCLIVRDDATEQYFKIEVTQTWECVGADQTTLAELCDP